MAPPILRPPPLGIGSFARWRWLTGRLVVLMLVAAGFVMLGSSRANPNGFGGLRGWAGDMAAPVLSAIQWPGRTIGSISTTVRAYFSVMARNRELERQLAGSSTLHEDLERLRRENRNLKSLLRLAEPGLSIVATTRIIGTSAGSYMSSALVPAGRSSGVRIGQPVRDGHGLIGRVLEAGARSARIMLISDINSRIPVLNQRTGQAAMVAGTGGPVLRLRYVAQNADDRAGDLFVTSGHGGLFPPGIPVGAVLDSTLAEPSLRPAANLDSLDFALILRPYFPPAAATAILATPEP